MLNQERDTLVFVSENPQLQTRFKQVCEYLPFNGPYYSKIEDVLSLERMRPRTFVVDVGSGFLEKEKDLQKLRQNYPKAALLVVATELTAEILSKCESLRNTFVVEESVFQKTFAAEYFVFQKGYSDFFEISASDMFPDTVVFFNAFHFLPLNQRYLPIVHEDFVLSDKKHKRLEAIKTLFIQYKDSQAYSQYIEKYFDQFNLGLKKRVRAKVYELASIWKPAVFEGLFKAQKADQFAQKHSDFSLVMNDLIEYLRAAPDPWALIFEISQFDILKFEGSLLELIISCFFTRYIGEDEMERIFDLKWAMTQCRLKADPLVYKKWLVELGKDFSKEDKDFWSQHLDQVPAHFQDPLRKDLELYRKIFLKMEEKDVKDATLIHVYWGEITSSVFQSAKADQYKKNDLMESILVRCKADTIISEAWIEELRNFIVKGPEKEDETKET